MVSGTRSSLVLVRDLLADILTTSQEFFPLDVHLYSAPHLMRAPTHRVDTPVGYFYTDDTLNAF